MLWYFLPFEVSSRGNHIYLMNGVTCTPEAKKLIAKSHRWQRTAVAVATSALLAMAGGNAMALSLGRITVKSALGEPLQAEIDVPDINAEEAASLKAKVASGEAFTAAGLEFNAALANLQATLMRRADGSAYLRLTTDRPVNDPFVDMLLETSWSSGRIVRDFTMLFDPVPPKAPVAAQAPTLPQTTAPAATVPTPVVPVPPATMAAPEIPARTTMRTAPPATSRTGGASGNLTVKNGDTASRIASENKAGDVSLDQMLVAMLRANPDAFSRNNLNRLRAGATLNLPDADTAKAIPAAEATREVRAQSKDFNEFRRTLADNAPRTDMGTPDRKAAGNVEPKVGMRDRDRSAPDKLTLSKGALAAHSKEAGIAKERADRDAADRASELAKNIADLTKLTAQAGSDSTAMPASAANAPSVAPAVVPAVPEQAASAAPEVVASAPGTAASTASVKPRPLPIPAPPEPNLVEQLMAEPMLPLAAGGAVIALLGGLFFYRRHQAKKQLNHVDSSFLESRLPTDSFFDASGGARVDTMRETGNSSSSANAASAVYANSQMENPDDVDPVAEADVYLAYGRDLQAEEILKEALRHAPERLAIHAKLLEIFAKRRDAASYEETARRVQALTGGSGPEWTQARELGAGIDPGNPLYQTGMPAAPAIAAASSIAASIASTAPQPSATDTSDNSTLTMESHAEKDGDSRMDLDLDLNFSEEDAPASVIKPATSLRSAPAPISPAPAAPEDNSLDFDLSMPTELSQNYKPSGPAQLEKPSSPVPATAQAPSNLMNFDLDSLSLDLDVPSSPGGNESAESATGSHATKLALAEEFVSIGDDDGARALIEEVIADASGPLLEQARAALARLN